SLVVLAFVGTGCAGQPTRTTAKSSPLVTSPRSPSVSPVPKAPPPAWPANLEGHTLRFPSIDRAVRFLSRNLSIPVRLPRGLPQDLRLDPHLAVYLSTQGGQRAAQLDLVFGTG